MAAPKAPRVLPALLLGDSAILLAETASALARKDHYLPIVDGPRLSRPDGVAEVIRRNNAAARAAAKVIYFVGLADHAMRAFDGRFPADIQKVVASSSDVVALAPAARRQKKSLPWGPQRLGVGLYQALREGRLLDASLPESPDRAETARAEHLVVCEDDDDTTQLIAAVYAYALGAEFCLMPTPTREDATRILERLNNVYEDRSKSATDTFLEVRAEMRRVSGSLPIRPGTSVTFISTLPLGFAFPEAAATHLNPYPDLGISVLNGLCAEQPEELGIGVTVLVDPETVAAAEIAAAEKLLPARGIFVRSYRGRAAAVHEIARMLELFPYDLLIIATHCGDIPGWRWTYEFTDSEGIPRRLEVDTAIGIGDPRSRSREPDRLLEVTQYFRMISLDGVDWADDEAKKALYVGRAILDWSDRLKADDLEPVSKVPIPRVLGSAALRLNDHNLIALPTSLAANGTPIVVNNACGSWHRLSDTFTFGNARAYIGTLFSVSDPEAELVVSRMLDKHFSKPLPIALWLAQNEIYGENPRRPYAMSGAFPQRIWSRARNIPKETLKRLVEERRAQARLLAGEPPDEKMKKGLEDRVAYLDYEINAFIRNYIAPTVGASDGRAVTRTPVMRYPEPQDERSS